MLLFYLKPFHNESLTGLFYRTARENLMDNLSWIKDNFLEFSGYKLNENFINWGDPKVVEDISKFLKIDLEVANKMTFTFLLDSHNLKVDLNKNKIKCPWFLYQTTKVCPECVKENPYHRMEWSFTYSTICSKHKVFLKDKCQCCKREFTIKSVVNDKCICGMPLSSSSDETVTDPLIFEYQKEIDIFFSNYIITNQINSWVLNSSVFYNSLEFLATWLPQTINNDDILTIENKSYSGNAIARTRLKKSKTLLQACSLYLHSFKILKEWPEGCHEYFRLIKKNDDNDKLRIFIDNLNKLIGTGLEPLYIEFMNFLLQKQQLNSEQFISLKLASKISNLKEDTIRKSKFFNLEKCNFNEIEFYFVNKNDIQNWLSLYNETITKEELRVIWGTSPKATFNILSNNVLKSVINIQMGSMQKWEIPKIAIEDLNLKLKTKSTIFSGPKILLNKALEWVGVHHSHIVIKNMLSGDLPFELNVKKFGDTLISKHKLFKFIRKFIIEKAKRSKVIIFQDASFLLGVKKKDIQYWIETHRLAENDTNEITYDSFMVFQSKYFTTLEISLIKNITIKAILKKCSNGQIIPIAGPCANDGERNLYKKEVLKQL